jgi:hypothetical protein
MLCNVKPPFESPLKAKGFSDHCQPVESFASPRREAMWHFFLKWAQTSVSPEPQGFTIGLTRHFPYVGLSWRIGVSFSDRTRELAANELVPSESGCRVQYGRLIARTYVE